MMEVGPEAKEKVVPSKASGADKALLKGSKTLEKEWMREGR
jgi:hypothetical protein